MQVSSKMDGGGETNKKPDVSIMAQRWAVIDGQVIVALHSAGTYTYQRRCCDPAVTHLSYYVCSCTQPVTLCSPIIAALLVLPNPPSSLPNVDVNARGNPSPALTTSPKP